MTIRRPLWASQRGGTQMETRISFPTDADGNGVLTDDEVGENIEVRVALPKVAKVGDVITATDGITPADITLIQADLDAGYVESTFPFPESNLFNAQAWITHTADPNEREIGVMLAPTIGGGSYDETTGEIVLDFEDDSTGAPDYREVYRDTSPMDAANLPAPRATNLPASQTQFREAVAEDGTTYYYRTANVKGSARRVSDEVSLPAEPGGATDPAGPDFSTATIGDEIGGGIYAGIDTIDGTDYHIVAGKADSETYGLQWKPSRSLTAGTESDTDGLANSLAMQSAGLSNHPAAEHCLLYAGGGHDDWHMPARSQLGLIYSNLAGHAEFANNTSSGNFTWTSTQTNGDFAWGWRFSDGLEHNAVGKNSLDVRTRPVRRVPV